MPVNLNFRSLKDPKEVFSLTLESSVDISDLLHLDHHLHGSLELHGGETDCRFLKPSSAYKVQGGVFGSPIRGDVWSVPYRRGVEHLPARRRCLLVHRLHWAEV